MNQILEGGRMTVAVINDILDFSKIEAGHLTIDRQPFSLASTLAEVDSLLGSTARGKGLDLHIECSPEIQSCVLLGDTLRLEQVLINLIGNAVRFTEHGNVRLCVKLQILLPSTARLRFEVQDTGIGIEPALLPRLFEPFVQGDPTNTRRFGGTGLGLSISRRLVELMGGVIGVESVVGHGSTFWFELPFDLQHERNFTKVSPIEPAQKGAQLSGIHCLVVDDTRLSRLVVQQMLAGEGARATMAVDGQQAVQYVQAQPMAFDAVLMDLQMPIMDRFAATRIIRTELGLKELPIIALTMGVLPEQRKKAIEAGCNDFLGKPVDLEELVTTLVHVVRPGAIK